MKTIKGGINMKTIKGGINMKTIISLALILMLSLPIASSIETLICSEKTINCGISCGKCPYSGYDYCQWSWVREGEYSYRGELNPGDPIPRWDELRFGYCNLYGITLGVTPTTTTTTTVPTITTTTTTPPEVSTLICSESTINCKLSCGKCPYSGYDYCQWSWVREGEYSYRGELNPGDPIPTSQDELRFGLCTIHGINIPPVPTPILSDLIAKIQVLFQTLTSWIANLFG